MEFKGKKGTASPYRLVAINMTVWLYTPIAESPTNFLLFFSHADEVHNIFQLKLRPDIIKKLFFEKTAMVLPACEKMGLVQAAYWSVFVQVSPKEQQPWGLKKIRTPWIDGDPIFWWIFFFIPWMRFEQLIWWLGSKKYLKVFKQWNSIARKWLDTIFLS